MRLDLKLKDDSAFVKLHDYDGKVRLAVGTPIPEALPAFKSGDLWIVEAWDDSEVDTVYTTVASVWINPETGEIKVTLMGQIKRKPFSVVNKWIMQLDL